MLALGYVYFGKCSDGRYWYVQDGKLKYVIYDRERRRVGSRYFTTLRRALQDKTIFTSLPREVRQYLTKLRDRLIEKVGRKARRLIEKISRRIGIEDMETIRSLLLEILDEYTSLNRLEQLLLINMLLRGDT